MNNFDQHAIAATYYLCQAISSSNKLNVLQDWPYLSMIVEQLEAEQKEKDDLDSITVMKSS